MIADLCVGARLPARAPTATATRSSACATEIARVSGPRRAADRRSCAEADVDLLLVTDLVNVRYLTGYTGSQRARA